MCGIFAILNNDVISDENIMKSFNNIKTRGPEYSNFVRFSEYNINLGFHRLAINGLDDISNQPIKYNKIHLICNGEIYNYKSLFNLIENKPITNSDCEIIIYLYQHFGIEYTLSVLDGVFSFILYDEEEDEVFVARDPFGVRPLFYMHDSNQKLFSFASELKGLGFRDQIEEHQVGQFIPGTYSQFTYYNNKFNLIIKNKHFYLLSNSLSLNFYPFSKDSIINSIQYSLRQSVLKRCLNTDRKVACLLSGGLDSSLITMLVNENHISFYGKPVETFSIGYEGSDDLIAAKKVANHLGTNHTEILLDNYYIIDYIDKVIFAIESYDVTTIRASIGNYILGEYISQHSEAKVIFNGDGSDEVLGGYLYCSKCPNALSFDFECKQLINNIHYFDVLRSDRCISFHGLEPRTPFLDKAFVQNYLNIPSEIRYNTTIKFGEKYLLRKAFSSQFYFNTILPSDILFRKKEAFSDGVSKQKSNFYKTIREHIGKLNSLISEEKYYFDIYNKYYPNSKNLIPYKWMPKFMNAIDPSARTIFDTKIKIKDRNLVHEDIFN